MVNEEKVYGLQHLKDLISKSVGERGKQLLS